MRRRLIWTFALFSIGLTTLFGALIISVYHHSEDWTYRKQLAKVMEDVNAGLEDVHVVQVFPEDAFDGALGERLRKLEEGYHEVTLPLLDSQNPEEVHLLLEQRPDGSRHLALIRVPELEAVEHRAALAVWAGVMSLSVLGLLLGTVLARRSVRPIEELSAWLRKGDPNEAPPRKLPDPETRLLAESLERFLVQQTRQLDRERSFLREASHELRNPINIVKGVSELAQEQQLSEEGLERIQRSVLRMEHTVEGLLALARQEQRIQGVSMQSEWQALLEEYREGFSGSIEARRDWDPKEPLAVRMIILVTGTLLHNAVEHAEATEIRLELSSETLCVQDNGRGLERLDSICRALDRGHPLPCGGLGLALVARICRRMEWKLQLENAQGLRVHISF